MTALLTYAVVSPVRDEAEHLPRTAAALIAQTHRPAQWVIVDDGSADGTRAIADGLAAEHDWITVIGTERKDRRARGAPIVAAFERGKAMLNERPDVVVKLDGDIYLPPHYFTWVCAVFERDPRAGIVGGTVLIHDGATWRPERSAAHNVNGVAKAYRLHTLDDIGGLRQTMGWDGIDEYGARARGWHVHVLNELPILHYRLRGSAQNWWRARWEEGRANHYMGYRPAFMAVRVGYRMLVEPPRVLGGLLQGAGFIHGHLTRAPTIDDELAKAELRREQAERLRALVGRRGTAATTRAAALPDGGPAFWDL